MKKIILLIAVAITGTSTFAQYHPVDDGSSIQFKIKNFGINTGGSFSGLQGNIKFDPGHLSDANVEVSIDAKSINTNNEMRDSHLRNDGYFDVTKYPRILFASTKLVPSSKAGEMMIFGKLTIKDHTKDVSFPFTATPSNDGYLFKGAFTINRRDFEVGGSSPISDNLEVQLNILARKS